MNENLFDKYDVPVPRYTSYPALPHWQNNLSTEAWISDLQKAFHQDHSSWSLYIHLPFCESLCTFCACNNVITRDHSKEERYIAAVKKEWGLYKDKIREIANKPIRQVHLGGGSPTFFSPENLKNLLTDIFKDLKIDFEKFEGAVEVDPRRCTPDQLKTLREIGFNRISLGVQDFDEDVQKNVNRIQPFDLVKSCTDNARSLGFGSINFDLIYGLPGQTIESITETAKKTLLLKPDRIALYSLAVVPWLKPAQNRFQKMEMKKGFEKRLLFEAASKVFLDAGYIPLGIDHFALPTDSITKAHQNQSMHRNFMGYTEYATDILLGLGATAISETPTSFHQNLKTVDEYYKALELDEVIPTLKGHSMSCEDVDYRRHILDLMTNHETQLKEEDLKLESFSEMVSEGLLSIDKGHIKIHERGIPFTRHICHKVDRYNQNSLGTKFSSGV